MTLLSELQTDPASLGYAPLLAADNDQGVADLLNASQFTVPASRIITARGILSDYPGGPVAAASVLEKLDTAAPNIAPLKWAWAFIKGEGIDIGHPATHGMLDQLAGLNIITSDEAAKLKGLANAVKSRSEVLFGKQVSANDIARVVRDDVGNSLLGV